MSNAKVIIIHLIVGLIKKIFLYKMSYFPEPYGNSRSKIKVDLKYANYATKSYLKSATSVDTSKSAKDADMPSLKSSGLKTL